MEDHPQFKAWVALVAVCFFWGTTYLGIRIALETFSPLVLVCSRFLISGVLIVAGAKIAGYALPRGKELLRTSLNGVIVLGIGNGCLAIAEQWVPSGLAALFITTGPFWMVGMEALVPGGAALHMPTILGMLIGVTGVGVLLSRDGIAGINSSMLAGFLVLQLGCLGWSSGAIMQRRQSGDTHPIVSGGIQQLATGVALLLPMLLIPTAPIHWNWRGIAAVVYLITFGSIVGYSAFIYAMSELPVSVVSIYNYINPIVAVILGWMVYREPFGIREVIAMSIIFAGVYTVKRYGQKH